MSEDAGDVAGSGEDDGDGLAPNEAEATATGSATDGGTSAEATSDCASPSALADANVWRYLGLGAIGLLSLLALVATLQLYWNASAAIGEWVAPAFVPVFQAAFNLVVLLLALSGLAVLARRRVA